MRTPLCDDLGIEFPIFAFTHCRDVVAAVSKAGGFGVLGAVGFSPEQLEVELAWIDDNVGDAPYGVDVVIPGKYEGMGEEDPGKLDRDALEDEDPDHGAGHLEDAATPGAVTQRRGRLWPGSRARPVSPARAEPATSSAPSPFG